MLLIRFADQSPETGRLHFLKGPTPCSRHLQLAETIHSRAVPLPKKRRTGRKPVTDKCRTGVHSGEPTIAATLSQPFRRPWLALRRIWRTQAKPQGKADVGTRGIEVIEKLTLKTTVQRFSTSAWWSRRVARYRNLRQLHQ